MMDFLGSVVNIIGDHINKLVDLVFGKVEEPKPAAPQKPIKEADKPVVWTRKKK